MVLINENNKEVDFHCLKYLGVVIIKSKKCKMGSQRRLWGKKCDVIICHLMSSHVIWNLIKKMTVSSMEGNKPQTNKKKHSKSYKNIDVCTSDNSYIASHKNLPSGQH